MFSSPQLVSSSSLSSAPLSEYRSNEGEYEGVGDSGGAIVITWFEGTAPSDVSVKDGVGEYDGNSGDGSSTSNEDADMDRTGDDSPSL